jgi:hypothetical protein
MKKMLINTPGKDSHIERAVAFEFIFDSWYPAALGCCVDSACCSTLARPDVAALSGQKIDQTGTLLLQY